MRPTLGFALVSLALSLALGSSVAGLTATAAAAQASRQPSRVWMQVDGTVEKVDGDWLTFKLDDGRRMVVDIMPMSVLERAGLVPGERTALIGYTDQRQGRFVAWFLPVAPETATAATASPSALPRTEGTAPAPRAVDPQAWRIAHGRVDGLDGTTLMVRTDEGLAIGADVSAVDPGMLRSVARGELVTVIGFPGSGPDRIAARYVHRDAAEVAGAPTVR
jgi:hypothetical protein